MEKANLSFKYLNHIDALRAFSVISVILFHLNEEIFYYGFLGVDIFFVISGYVITNSLYSEQIKQKKSIFFFYVKRIKRIFPILFLVIFSFLIAYIFLSPLKGNTNFFLESAISSLIGLSNFYFLNNDINYFFSDEINPLLHTWSLGIEEQFYLIYPVLLVLIFKAFKADIEKISVYMLLFIIFSFTVYYFEDGIIGNFYSPLARFWEIGIGCFAFFYSSVSIKKKKKLIYIFSILIIYLLFNFQNEKSLQNANFIATIFTFIFLVKLKTIKNKKFKFFIEKSGLPYMGRLSYSLYLWHLPILYFCEIYFSGIEMFFIFFSSSLTLSILSYHFYENPIRKSDLFNSLTINLIKNLHYIFIMFLIMFTLVFNNLNLNNTYNFLKKFNYPEQKLKKFLTRLDYKRENYLNAECKYKDYLNQCIKNKDFNYSIYITGDSHSEHFLISIDNIDYINRYFHNNFAQCKIILDSMYNSKILDFINDCKKNYNKNYEKFIIDKLNTTETNSIIISLRLSDYLSSDWKLLKNLNDNKKDIIIENYLKFINLFPKKDIILITTVPESKVHSDKCIFNEFLRKKIDIEIFEKCHFKKSDDKKRYEDVKDIVFTIAKKNKYVRVFDPYPLLCPSDICHNYDEKNNFFMLQDGNHLSIEANKFIAKDLSSFLKNK